MHHFNNGCLIFSTEFPHLFTIERTSASTNKTLPTVHFLDSDLCSFPSLSPVSTWTMGRHQVEAPWTLWPARAQASSCRPILSTANEESRSCTAPTATMTSRPSLCPETPPLPVTCECLFEAS